MPVPFVLRAGLMLLVALVAFNAGGAPAGDASVPAPTALSWRNPVLPEDFPDPSATRVDGVYWATATSSVRAPGFPLMRSIDLVHWEPAGTIFPHIPAWADGELWAPELVVNQDGTLVYFTAHRRGGGLCVGVASAPGPAGPYTDHGPLVCQRAGSIDPTVGRDADGRPYLLWKEDGNAVGEPSRIWIKRLRRNGIGVIGPRRELLHNQELWEGAVVEAPEIVAHDGWLYLFYSGNTYGPAPRCAYALGVARSRTLFGPWQRAPTNPILRSNSAWRCPGHASPVSDSMGRTFLLYHAYRAGDASAAAAPRQALLDRVTWSPDGWPLVNDGHGPSTQVALP